MDFALICGLLISVVLSCTYLSIIYKNEGTINYLLKVIKEMEKENHELNDHIRELLYPDAEPNDEIDWFNKDKN